MLSVIGGTISIDCSFFKFTLVPDSVLPFCILLVFEFLLGISETVFCSVSAVRVNIVLLLDVLQLLMLFAGTLMYVFGTKVLSHNDTV
jgi:hypothetical protein